MSRPAAHSHKALFMLLIIALVLIVSAVFDLVFVSRSARHDGEFLTLAGRQSVLSQSIANDAEEASLANSGALQRLVSRRDQFDHILKLMSRGDSQSFMPAVKGDARAAVRSLGERWVAARSAVQTIIDRHNSVRIARQALVELQQSMPVVLENWNKVTDALVGEDLPRSLIYRVSRQAYYGERMLSETTALVHGGGNLKQVAGQLGENAAHFQSLRQALFDGNSALGISRLADTGIRNLLHNADSAFGRFTNGVKKIVDAEPALIAVHQAVADIKAASPTLLSSSRALVAAYQRQVAARLYQPMYGYILGGAGLLVLGLIIYIYLLTGDVRHAAELQQAQTERNQEAILRLLDELGSLADGDLTVEATVTEDITGAIADSINFAIEALRDLVATIKETAVQVDGAAHQTQATAAHLADATVNQNRQISTASNAIANMATSTEQVSANAERSSQVARQSVEIAHKGGAVVRRTIDGMTAIRETIQETSKRIKRLGESSQEIGDIVELINDIAEQTNILALNAAIQASMAGEAGRGFAVVADEVQRLAERSANATRQIEALVGAIQTDTNEAVISMEQSTAGVVAGAELAENAGSALDEIEKVSNHMATLIQSISDSAHQQAAAAGDVSQTMTIIRDITSQTAGGTSATARSIGKLAALATELRKSVAGFKLPGRREKEDQALVLGAHASSRSEVRQPEMQVAGQA